MRSEHNIGRPSSLAFPALLGLIAVLASGCPSGGDGTSCGPNTEQVDGKCVSTVNEAPCGEGASRNADTGQCEPDVDCGPGTTYDPQGRRCTPDSVCGAGTTFNEATGQCDPDVVCGDDTTFDPSTGTCRPDVVCGDGTALDPTTGLCVPVGNCGTGTTLDPTTGMCVADIVCGPGLTAIDGVCLSALDLITGEADAGEATPDGNDPTFGGAPEGFVLEGAGERAIFTGTIQRPVDFDGNAVLDQDRDVWRFTGTAGQMLRIRVVSTGAFQPAFTLTGPNEYYREPQLGFTIDADREVVLPYDGEYDITVLPSLVLQGASEPLGDDEAVYAGVVEVVPWPALQPVTVASDGSATAVQGTLLGLRDNFFSLTLLEDVPVLAEATAPSGNTTPVLLLFTGNGAFLQEVAFEEDDGIEVARIGRPGNAEEGLVALLDWRTSNGIDVPFTFMVSQLEDVDFGTVGVDETVQLPAQLVLGLGAISLSFEVTAGQVILSDFAGLSSRLTLLSPSGETLYSGPDPFYDAVFYAKESGRYRWIAVSTSTSDSNASVAIRSYTPHHAGTFDGLSEQTMSFSGDAVEVGQRPSGAWFLVENTGPAIVQVDFDWALGEPDLELYPLSDAGFADDRRFNGEDDPATLRAHRAAPALTLARLDPGTAGSTPNPWVHDWEVSVSVIPVPTLMEQEPNDEMGATQSISGSPLRLLGAIAKDEIDLYTFTLDTPLAAGEALRIDVETLSATSSTQLRIRAPGTQLSDPELYESAQAPLTRWMLFPSDGAGPFVLELEGTNDDGVSYLLEVERVSVTSETEDNDAVGAPEDLGTFAALDLPFEIYGTTSDSDADVFRFSLDAPLPAGSALRVRCENLVELHDLDMAVYDAAGSPLLSLNHEDGVLLVPVTSTDALQVEVRGESSSRIDLYRLVVDVLSPVEVEPNDGALQAMALPTLAAGDSASLWGLAYEHEIDTFAITLDAPLAAGEALAVRWYNKVGRGDIVVSVLDTAEQTIVTSEVYAGEVFFAPVGDAGPFFVKVTPLRSSADIYPELYRLEVERIDGVTVETEPNDDAASANLLTTPARVRALFYDDDADFYAITLPNDLTLGEKLVVDGVVPHADDFVTVRVLDDQGTELAVISDLIPYLAVDLPVTTAGTTYYVTVQSTGTLFTSERHAYDLLVDLAVP